MRTIERVEVFPVRIPVRQTFSFASGTAGRAGEGAPHVFVRVTDSEGTTGWGEGRPSPAWAYETLESVTTTLRQYLAPAVQGVALTDRHTLHQRMHSVIGRGPSTGQPVAKAALDMAVHDACARALDLPLRAWLGGGSEARRMPLSFTVTAHDAAEAAEQVAEARSQGFLHFNFKAAVDPATDVAVAQAVRAAAGDGAFLWADANQGFRLHDARRVAEAFADVGVDVLEQPVAADRMGLMRQLRRASRIALAVDEAAVSPADFLGYVSEGLVDYVIVKLTRSGGIWPTLQQIAIAEAAGLSMLVSGLTDSLLTKVAALQVAAAFGYRGPSALNGSQFIDESPLFPAKGEIESDGHVQLTERPGIGVEPDEAALQAMLARKLT